MRVLVGCVNGADRQQGAFWKSCPVLPQWTAAPCRCQPPPTRCTACGELDANLSVPSLEANLASMKKPSHTCRLVHCQNKLIKSGQQRICLLQFINPAQDGRLLGTAAGGGAQAAL